MINCSSYSVLKRSYYLTDFFFNFVLVSCHRKCYNFVLVDNILHFGNTTKSNNLTALHGINVMLSSTTLAVLFYMNTQFYYCHMCNYMKLSLLLLNKFQLTNFDILSKTNMKDNCRLIYKIYILTTMLLTV